MLVSHSQAPVHICHKTWWFFKSAQACMTLGCSPRSFRHAYVLRVHKILAKQIMTKSSECPEFSHSFKERWRWVERPTRWLGMLESDCKGSHCVPTSIWWGQTPDTKGLLGTLWGHCEAPSLAEESCTWSAHNYLSWLQQSESKVEQLQLVVLVMSEIRLAGEKWLKLGGKY